MITRILYDEEKPQYNSVVNHPLQTWEWGDFQKSEGHKVYRLGVFDNNKIISGYTVSFHYLPRLNYSIGTLLRGPKIDKDMIENVSKIARDENAIFVKFEPDEIQTVYHNNEPVRTSAPQMDFPHLVVSPKVMFYPFSYIVDLTKGESGLLESLHPKTRYNIKVANRHGVVVEEKTNDEGFEIYLKLLFETTRRQGFYLHSETYHRRLWSIFKGTGIPRIVVTSYQNKPLAALMLFVFKDRLFYPYGASTDLNREVQAPTLQMWESIKIGLSHNLKSFDMWGSLGPDAKEIDQGYGFHRFKQGFGGQLVKFVGTYDLVINFQLYRLYNFIDSYRWKFLRLKAKIFH